MERPHAKASINAALKQKPTLKAKGVKAGGGLPFSASVHGNVAVHPCAGNDVECPHAKASINTALEQKPTLKAQDTKAGGGLSWPCVLLDAPAAAHD